METRTATFPAAFALVLLLLLSNGGTAKEAGSGFYEGQSFSTVGFSKENKTVLVEVNDYQRGTYISVYKTRNGEKIRDYRVEAGKTKAKLKALSRKGVMDDPGEPGAVSPKDGTTITGIFNGRDMALQVQAGTTLGFLDVLPLPTKDGVISQARIKSIHWDSKGKTVAIIVTWEFEENARETSDTLHVYRYRPWKIRWQE